MRFRAPSIFYGWYIVGAGLAINMLMGGLVMHAFGFYAVALKDEFAWSATIFGIAAAVTRVESGLLGPIQGAMVDRFGPRAMMRLGVTTTALGMILFALLQDEVSFIGFYILLSIGTSIGGFMTVSVAVVTWFERKRSRAIGLMSMGFTFGSIVAIIASWLIFGVGWRETSAGTGVFLLIVGWALSYLFVRHPSDKGLEVDGGPEPVKEADIEGRDGGSPRRVAPGGNPYRHRDFTAREALRTRAFWGLALAHGAPLMVIGMWLGHGLLHIAELPGFSASSGRVVLMTMVAAQLAGQLLVGLRWRPLSEAAAADCVHAGPRCRRSRAGARGELVAADGLRGAQRPGLGRARDADHFLARGLLRSVAVWPHHGLDFNGDDAVHDDRHARIGHHA